MKEAKDRKFIRLPVHKPRGGIIWGIELVKARERAGLTQEQLAERCGWTRGYICQLESCKEKQLSEESIKTLQESIND